MFERNRIERTNETEKVSSSVEVTLDDGSVVQGRVHYANTRSLGEELSNTSQFIDFEAYNGERFFLIKGALKAVRPMQIPRADQLSRAQRQSELFNPWTVLGIAENASKEQIREAYHRLVKRYHPDRFATLDLPAEVAEYLNAMARRINSAYTSLSSGQRAEAPQAAAV